MLKINSLQFDNPKLQQKIKKRLKSKANLEIGFIDGAKYPNGASVASVAFWNNYGTWNIPARPFFDNAISENKKKWFQTYKQAIQSGRNSIEALEITGTVAKDDISQSIVNYNEVPNAEVTINGGFVKSKTGKIIKIEGKGSSNPLVNTAFMASNVTYKVNK